MSSVRTHSKHLTREKEQVRIKELLNSRSQLGMVACTFDPSTQEAKVDRHLGVQVQLCLHRKFQTSQRYLVRSCPNKTKQTKNRNKKGAEVY